MNHAIHRVVSFSIVAPYTLTIQFADGGTQTINFRPILQGQIYGPLQDLAIFNAVQIDPEISTLVWPNGADFDPETLRNWHIYEKEWIDRAKLSCGQV
jgi:Protein of unknown function (DUF2442)